MTLPTAPARITAPISTGSMYDAPRFIHPRIAGSIDRCEIATTNSDSAGAGTGSVVSSQSEAVGKPLGRAASRIWWLVEFIRAPSGFECQIALR